MTIEFHQWKLGKDCWATLTISGRLTAEPLERLRRYLDLVDADPPIEGPKTLEEFRELEKR